jgi:hypothetical protein
VYSDEFCIFCVQFIYSTGVPSHCLLYLNRLHWHRPVRLRSQVMLLGNVFRLWLGESIRYLHIFLSDSNLFYQPWCFYQAGASTSCYVAQSGLKEPFSSSEVATMKSYFMQNINIQGQGGIVAAPDTNTPGGSYYCEYYLE